ncbi:MAG: hypothetical protein CL521_04660, partial [Actinobacteria bacterium]|nr:hypothetical protein [Actinomycetota bacterium]
MQKKQMLIVTMIFLVLGMGAVQAIEEVGSEFLTLRQQAMGGVSVTIARGHSAITNNPAALKFSKPEFKWPRFSAALSNDYQAHTDTLAKLTDMESEVSDQIQHLKDIVPVKIGMQFAANPLISLSGNRFGVGIFGKGRFIGRLYRVSNPKFKFDGYYDSNSAFAYATQINFGLPVSVGVSLRYLERYRVYDKATGEESVDLTTAQILSKVNDTEGDFDYGVVSKYGIFMDVGGIISFNDHKGKMGVVYKNLGSGFKGTKELASGVNQDVDDLLMPSVRVGASYDFDFFNQE